MFIIPSELIPFIIFAIIFVIFLILRSFYKKIVYKEIKLVEKGKPVTEIRKNSETYKDGVIVISSSGEVIYSTKSSADILGIKKNFDKKELRDALVIKLSQEEPVSIYDLIARYSNEIHHLHEFTLRGKVKQTKGEIPVKILMGSMSNQDSSYVIGISDLRDELEFCDSLQKDQLTNLPNQNRAIYEIGTIMSKMHSENRHFALILISVDNFTDMRAMLGYQKIDSLISKISEHLQDITRRMDSSIYQMLRNIFLLMVPDIESAQEAHAMARQIEGKFQGLQEYTNAQMHLSFSTGISLFPQSGNSVDLLLDSAYKALAEAEAQGGGYVIIDEAGTLSKDKQYEVELYNEMHDALKNREFELYYQPLIDMSSDTVLGAEALIRWNHPKRGLVSPVMFIPLAEKTGFIIELGRFVIEEAIKQQKRWEVFKFNRLQVSINLTLREIESGEVVDFIAKTLTENQVSPGLIKFEVTENMAMVNAETTQQEFESLKKLGVHLSLDDFGTGYSSFTYLKDFPLDTLKIDQSFVRDMTINPQNQNIVRAMIGIGHTFDLQVTAEGIEDKETYDMLKEFGCDVAQGYYFSKPVPVFEFQQFIRNKNTKKS
ncbi:MAG: bifunctional diguanylate cyclase/phosphodiesterase [Campylobacterota bacterium]|nr:bifunctional diguanylate cyclase/phosphodiesterase [Campylobacterota bacterium]